MNKGVVKRVSGPVVDVLFPAGALPEINNAIEISLDDRKIVMEAIQLLGDRQVRCISLFSTDGLYKEIDWDLSYTIGDFSIHLLDYFSHVAGTPEYYFDCRHGLSSHMDEIGLLYESSAIPLNIGWYTFVWGDWKENEDGSTGPLTFSSFLDIGTYYEF